MTRQVNVEQARAWDGADGDDWTDNEVWYGEAHRFLTPVLFDAARIGPREDVLDLGCGTGETTLQAARQASTATVFGIDLSSRMIDRARRRAAEEQLDNVRFERGDAQVYPFNPGRFDVVISRFGTMFFDDPVEAFANIRGAMSAGGRLAMLCWRDLDRNEWLLEIRNALAAGRDLPRPPLDRPSPLGFADSARVRGTLTGAGFVDVSFEPVDVPIYAGADASDAYASLRKLGVVRGLLKDLDDGLRSQALARLRQMIDAHETDEGVLLGSSAWLVQAANAR